MRGSRRCIGRIGLWVCLVWLTACSYPTPDYAEWDLTPQKRDSLRFLAEHHYTTNYNFLITGDSLKLNQGASGTDSLFVYKGEEVVVADFRIVPKDTLAPVWIKVARDQETMGWVPEQTLLEKVVPVDPISRFIHLFSNVHVILFLAVLGLFVLHFLYRHMGRNRFRMARRYSHVHSIYPTLLCMMVACSATLYASMQLFVPHTWQHYYFHPTLNPFELPCILACFIASVWAIVLLTLALLDDLLHQTSPADAFFFLLGLGALCLFCYLFFTLSTLYYVGYPCLLVWLGGCIRHLCHTMERRYLCGCCGKEMHRKGVCPHCGAFNE